MIEIGGAPLIKRDVRLQKCLDCQSDLQVEKRFKEMKRGWVDVCQRGAMDSASDF